MHAALGEMMCLYLCVSVCPSVCLSVCACDHCVLEFLCVSDHKLQSLLYRHQIPTPKASV